MSGDQDAAPQNTREFLALWNDAVEEHLVHQLTSSIPKLLPGEPPMSAASAEGLARHVVRALRLTSLSGDPSAAVRHLVEAAAEADGSGTIEGKRGS